MQIVRAALTLVFATAAFQPMDAMAEATEIMVRVLSQDAKLIGTGVGGAQVTVTDAASGEVLAQGEHRGATGDTRRIMRLEPQQRESTLFDSEGAAGFLARFDIDEPTVVRITATGPLGNPDATMSAVTEMLVTPGAKVQGDGVVLILHGFNIDILTPEAAAAPATGPLRVLTNIGMMCGCPLTPGGLWDADTVEVTARLLRDGAIVSEAPLAYVGEASRFAGDIEAPGPGAYTLEVLAAQPSKANFGRARMPVAVPD